jgi:uncharacterized protein YcaQ
MRSRSPLSNREARWLALAAQGLGRLRPSGPASLRHLRGVVGAVGTIQVDAINVLERTQFLVPFSRVGAFDRSRLLAMSGPGGELFEYWGHAASLLPAADQPLFRWRMDGFAVEDGTKWRAQWMAWKEHHTDYLAAVLAEVRDRGPLAASQLADPRRRDGEWWGRRSEGRQAMEILFAEGHLAAWRNERFERMYDLPERVLPAAVLAAPTPSIDDAHRQLLVRAAAAHGVGTVRDLADYFRIKQRPAAEHLAELVEAGVLEAVEVEGWSEPGYVVAGTRPRAPRRTHGTLLSPFDSLVWERARTSRLFGFDYRIEVYTPAAKRTYGYFVLPFLLGDELVGRFDLKADRRTSSLLVQAAHAEPEADHAEVAAAAAVELDSLRSWLMLDQVVVVGTGDLAPALAAETVAVVR